MRKQEIKENQNTGMAIVSFLFPGVGQIIQGQVSKGIMLIVAWFVCLVLCLVLIGFPLLLILALYSARDAYKF
jgi:TM2 domain-containing membrane protein YozV